VKVVKTFVLAFAALLLPLLFIPAASAQSGMAKVRVIHASPDAPAVDVIINGNKVPALTNVPFFTASGYLDLPAGSYDIQVVPTGATTPVVIDAKGVALAGGQAYTIAATGKLAEIEATIITENLAAPAAGKAKVRVYHFSPDAPGVDVKVTGGPTLISNLAFPNASNALEVDAGTYNLEVTPAGAATPVVINLPNTMLEAGRTYDVFATNLLASITPELVVSAAPAAAPAAPATMPRTSDGGAAPLGLLVAGAMAMLGAGALLLRRRK
jgi:hypothetical protein